MAGEHIREMADEVAALMADRFGAPPRPARSGSALEAALFFHRAALPPRLRREAQRLAKAERRCATGVIATARQEARATRAHTALAHHLRRKVAARRPGGRIARLVATGILGLMLLAAAVLWLTFSRGRF